MMPSYTDALYDVVNHIAVGNLEGAQRDLDELLAAVDTEADPSAVRYYVFGGAIANRLSKDSIKKANLYLNDYEVPQIYLFNLLANRVPIVSLTTILANDAMLRYAEGRQELHLMDVGIEAKVEGSRILPDVTPIHSVPKAVQQAQEGMIEERFLDFSQLHKIYPTPKGPLTVVEDFDLKVNRGEFISLIGHSGCGKSTVLTMAAGLNDISKGAIRLDGYHVQGADPERAVVFQSPNLFPWLTARENCAIGVDKVYPKASQAERQDVVEYYLERVGLADAMDRSAADMSNGMKQRVGIARAFALSPKLLLLDEPFGMLDSLTRWELQEVLMEVWSRTKVTAICVTHDVDEAILLADRVVMMTNGPQATIGRIVNVDLPRPRTRKALLEHPDYYLYREQVLSFLEEYEHGAKPKAATPTAKPDEKEAA